VTAFFRHLVFLEPTLSAAVAQACSFPLLFCIFSIAGNLPENTKAVLLLAFSPNSVLHVFTNDCCLRIGVARNGINEISVAGPSFATNGIENILPAISKLHVQGRNEGGRGAQFPGHRIIMGGRITAGGTEKSQQCHKYFLQYSTSASERAQV